jgi:hypothetical protein
MGTFRDNDIIYDWMIKALSRVIRLLGKEERADGWGKVN